MAAYVAIGHENANHCKCTDGEFKDKLTLLAMLIGSGVLLLLMVIKRSPLAIKPDFEYIKFDPTNEVFKDHYLIAQEKLHLALNAFSSGLNTLIRFEMNSDIGTEYPWGAIESINDAEISLKLITPIHLTDKDVLITIDKIIDWVYYKEDESIGGYTILAGLIVY